MMLTKQVASRQLAEGLYLILFPAVIAPEFFRGEVANLPSDLPAGSRVEEKSAGPAREHVFNRARHLMTHRPDDFRPARWPRLAFAVAPAVQTQIGRGAGALLQPSHQRGLIHRILRHFTIRRPFSTTDGHQPGLRYRHAVVAWQRRRVLHFPHLAQRTQPREGAQDIARLWVLGEIPGGVREQKL